MDATSRNLPSKDNKMFSCLITFSMTPHDGNIIAKRKMRKMHACDVILPSSPLGESQAW